MRSIAQIIDSGINSLADLQDALLTAIQLEFSTIPPYLCAQWSIQPGSDPSNVAGMVQGVVVQEMLHFGLACNMLTAIGGVPNIASSDFVPVYPATGLPGGVQPNLTVSLLPLNQTSLDTFMQIEYPEWGPITAAAQEAATIGAFYSAISAGFVAVNPTFVSGALQVVTNVGSDNLVAVTTIAEAQAAIAEIQQQGEGTSSSPDEPIFDPNQLAHYYTFAQISNGAMFVETGGVWGYTGTAITMPQVYAFAPSTAQPNPSASFNTIFTSLLQALQNCWTINPKLIDAAISGGMTDLQTAGVSLIQKGITPQFLWAASKSSATSK